MSKPKRTVTPSMYVRLLHCVARKAFPGNACRRNKVIMFFQRVVVLGQDFFNTSVRKPQHPLVETRFIASENIGQPFACLGHAAGQGGRSVRKLGEAVRERVQLSLCTV